uniref:Uncharacterized protein n=1 Tax=Opuntia streptacantha TaxID=393608 RepID=A0A7C9D0X4_OPUST
MPLIFSLSPPTTSNTFPFSVSPNPSLSLMNWTLMADPDFRPDPVSGIWATQSTAMMSSQMGRTLDLTTSMWAGWAEYAASSSLDPYRLCSMWVNFSEVDRLR